MYICERGEGENNVRWDLMLGFLDEGVIHITADRCVCVCVVLGGLRTVASLW